MKNNTALQARLRRAGRRVVAIGLSGATAWGVAMMLVLMLAGIWLDLLWELSPQTRISVLWTAAAGGLAFVAGLVWRTIRSATSTAIARRLDAAVSSGGQILTGYELDESLSVLPTSRSLHPASSPAHPKAPGTGAGAQRPLTAGLSHIAVEHAAALAGRVPLGRAAPARPLYRSLAALLGLTAVVGLLALVLPRVARTEWDRFADPFADVPPYSQVQITVTPPGDKEVLYGDALDITATAEGGAIERMELVLGPEEAQETVLPMFPEADGSWRAVLAKVVEPAVYYVRAYRARSEKHRISVITVPKIEAVRVQVAPPAYAGQSTYEGALPDDGIKGLRSTKVTIWITSNRPLSGGSIVLRGADVSSSGMPKVPHADARNRDGRTAVGRPGACSTIVMAPTAQDSQEVAGQFEITGDGKFECRVIDDAGQPSQQSVSGSIAMLNDQQPFIRITQPQPVSLATPTARLPVVLSAEDDCGISRIQFFRSLNESRPLPADVPLAGKWPHRANEQVDLPLEGYGLEPGDVIKLFGRVEDNDPAGAKGAESQVVTVRIISQEEFERMLRVRQGMEVLASKYREAQRRMEGLTKDTEGLRKKLQKLPPRSLLAQETRNEMQKLQRLMRRNADDLRRSAAHKLPYDLDQKLLPQLDQLARMNEEMANELEKLEKQRDLTSEQLEKKLREMEERLKAARGEYQRLAIEPMEHLEAVFPLMVDQSRFVVLVLRQQDLAERMAGLKGHDGEDSPALKSRMRDLEHEQRQIREALDQLLTDIEDHATRLPAVPELERLRETAIKFAKDVRASGASEAMTDAEGALAEFAGTRAHEKSRQAADILAKFLNRCEGEGGLGEQCNGCLVFRPGIGNCLGQTAAQLLAEMSGGMSSGMGAYGTMGMYGQMAGMSGMGGGQYGEPHGQQGGSGEQPAAAQAGGGNPDRAVPGELSPAGAATAAGEALVPARYRQQVGHYFQRLAEELGNRPKPAGRDGKR